MGYSIDQLCAYQRKMSFTKRASILSPWLCTQVSFACRTIHGLRPQNCWRLRPLWLLSWPSCSRRGRCEGDLFFCWVAAFTGILRLMAWYTPRERSFSFPPKRYFSRHHLSPLGVQEKKAAAIKELNWFFLWLSGTYCGQTKRPELLFLNGFWPSWVFVRPSNGGAGSVEL